MVPFVVAAGCGGVLGSTSDAGIPANCATDGDCPSGYQCLYPVSGGCAATRTCLPKAPIAACKGAFYCTCNGSLVTVCGEGAPAPIDSKGVCKDATPPLGCGNSTSPACEVCDVSSYSPTPQGKPIAGANACSEVAMQTFVQACVGSSASQSLCAQWQKDNDASCVSCLITQSAASSWGALVCDSNGCSPNVGGCLDVTLGQVAEESPTSSGSCGDSYHAATGCLGAACASCTGNDLATCQNDAAQAACKSYVNATATTPACAGLDGGASACFPQSDADWSAFVHVFCGAP